MNEDLKDLIAETDNVHTIQEAKDFLQKIEIIEQEHHDEIVENIMENICRGNIYDAGNSDDKVRNVFSELNKAWSFGVNEYLKVWREF